MQQANVYICSSNWRQWKNFNLFAAVSTKALETVKCLPKTLFNIVIMDLCLFPCFYILFNHLKIVRFSITDKRLHLSPELYFFRTKKLNAYKIYLFWTRLFHDTPRHGAPPPTTPVWDTGVMWSSKG